MIPLNMIPWRLIGAGAAALAVVGAVLWYGSSRYDAGEAAGRGEVQAQWSAERARQTAEAFQTSEHYRAEESARESSQLEAINAAQTRIVALSAALDRAGESSQRLQRAVDAAASAHCRGAASDPAAAAGSPPAEAAGDLLVLVHRRLDEAAGGVGTFADKSRIAGQLCERAYDALTPEGRSIEESSK